MNMDDLFAMGFCKAAEEHGVDPVQLVKFAQVTIAGWGPRIVPEASVPYYSGRHYYDALGKLMGKADRVYGSAVSADRIASLLYPHGNLPDGGSVINALTDAPAFMGSNSPTSNFGDELANMGWGQFRGDSTKILQESINKRYEEICAKIRESHLPDELKNRYLVNAEKHKAKALKELKLGFDETARNINIAPPWRAEEMRPNAASVLRKPDGSRVVDGKDAWFTRSQAEAAAKAAPAATMAAKATSAAGNASGLKALSAFSKLLRRIR